MLKEITDIPESSALQKYFLKMRALKIFSDTSSPPKNKQTKKKKKESLLAPVIHSRENSNWHISGGRKVILEKMWYDNKQVAKIEGYVGIILH